MTNLEQLNRVAEHFARCRARATAFQCPHCGHKVIKHLGHNPDDESIYVCQTCGFDWSL